MRLLGDYVTYKTEMFQVSHDRKLANVVLLYKKNYALSWFYKSSFFHRHFIT